MSYYNVFQTKLKRLVFEPETVIGVPETFDGSSPVLPAYDISLSRSRGTQLISRSAVMDGHAGEMCGVPGSFGTELEFTTEIHDEDVAHPYWAKILYGCGWEGAVDGTVTTLTPSTKMMDDYTDGNPCAITMGLYTLIDGIPDTLQIAESCTGSMTLNMTTGERLAMTVSMVGINDDGFMDLDDEDASDIGTVSYGCAPYVCKDISVTMSDSGGGRTIDPVAIASVEISSNANVAEVMDPTRPEGFGISPVFWDEAPTVTIDIGATANNNEVFWHNFRYGLHISMTATFESAATGNTLTVTIGRIQFSGVTMSDRNGYETYQLEGRIVRRPGESYAAAQSEFSIKHTLN